MPVPAEPIELDLRVGGVWRQQMVISESTAYPTGGVYREIVRDEKLVFSWGAEGGWPELDPTRPEDSPLVTVLLAQDGARTAMTVTVELPANMTGEGMPRLVRPHAPRLAGHGRPACCVARERADHSG